MRAFIFSLDAFVAFTLALVAIYSLIFFSSVPSAYYYLLTQGHYLSRDILLSLSTTMCSESYGVCKVPQGSVLDNIVAQTDVGNRKSMIQSTVGAMVPIQFGYVMEMSDDEGAGWTVVYDTASEGSDPHAKSSKKLTVATQVITFGYSGKVRKLPYSPYNYLTCNGGGSYNGMDGTGGGNGSGTGGSFGANGTDFGIITCGQVNVSGGGGGGLGNVSGNGTGNISVNVGNTHPSNILGGDLVPSSDVRIVRLTVFI
ncbi:MAG: hypothetical protein U0R44_07070 [Candidatus Micrarchaeia archaeon]